MRQLLALPLAALLALAAGCGGGETGATKVDPGSYKTTKSGLKYAVISPGSGDVAVKDVAATVHYTGWLENGTKFDSSLDQGEPFRFIVGRREVIPAWDEGVAGMKVGEKRQLVVPPKLGYGPEGAGPIPPNATLIFDIELLKVG